MVLEVVAAAIIAFVFIRLAGMIRTGDRPKGKFWNFFEAMLLFMRDEVVRPAIGKHDADKFLPLLWTMFFFVLVCNLLGLVPWAGSPTAAFAVTLALAATTLATGIVSGVIKFGPVGYLKNQIPHMDLPLILAVPMKPMIWAIEVGGMLIKHGVLGVRLLANMVAGHIVLLSIMAIAFSVEGAMSPYWGIAAPISVLGATAISLLELFVAFLQAYVFVFLSSLFIGAAIHHH
jgi:F-type H+-transporting ATPase subunit a